MPDSYFDSSTVPGVWRCLTCHRPQPCGCRVHTPRCGPAVSYGPARDYGECINETIICVDCQCVIGERSTKKQNAPKPKLKRGRTR